MTSPSPTPSMKTLKEEAEKRRKSRRNTAPTINIGKVINLSATTSARELRQMEMPNLYSSFDSNLAVDPQTKRNLAASLGDLKKMKNLVLKSAAEDDQTLGGASSRSQSVISENRSESGPRSEVFYGPTDGIRVVGGTDPKTVPDPEPKPVPESDPEAEFDTPVGTLRTNSLWDFCKVGKCKIKLTNADLMLKNQQKMLLTDLIYTLAGTRCDLITPKPPSEPGEDTWKYEFDIHEKMDKSLANMVQEVLPLASSYMGIQKLIAMTENHSQVNNALNSALIDFTNDYLLLLGEAEQELLRDRLTLQKMIYYMHPTIWLMNNIWTCLSKILLEGLKGAAVLTNFCESISHLEGDTSSQTALMELAGKAAQPYMDMLLLWIEKGFIMDTFDEFMITDNKDDENKPLPKHYTEAYWAKRYTLRDECIPSFLREHSERILRAGKYLNVIRECGKRRIPSQNLKLSYDPKCEKKHVKVINHAYIFSARMLLDVLLNDNDLMGHLLSVKRYLLLNQGDFIAEFMDSCENELAKNVDHVLPITLVNLLGLSLRLTCARNDKYKDNVQCELLTYDLGTQMSRIIKAADMLWVNTDHLELTGLECFAFTYVAEWPVSLVLNFTSVSKYQMLFRQLFFCKHVERQLCRIWKENSVAKKFNSNTAELYRSAFTLRQRMMNAIQNLEYYMMIEIIEPNWHIFIEKMKTAENIDTVFDLHTNFLDECLKNCMLNEPPDLNRYISQLGNICLSFCEFIQQSQRFFLDAELKSMVRDSSDENTDHSDSDTHIPSSEENKGESLMNHSDTFAERIKSFDLEFTGVLISFLRRVNELVHNKNCYSNLVNRINFNGYYSSQLEKKPLVPTGDGPNQFELIIGHNYTIAE